MPNPTPLIQLEADGRAPVLQYNIPEPTRYSGRQVITLPVPERAFKRAAVIASQTGASTPVSSGSPKPRTGTDIPVATALRDRVAIAMRAGFRDAEIFPEMSTLPSFLNLRLDDDAAGGRIVASHAISSRLARLTADDITSQLAAGFDLRFRRNLFGDVVHEWVARRPAAQLPPRLMIVETYRLSSYPGAYGAGRVLNTFSLLPGEKTRINITTYEKSEETRKRASSILDSLTQESSNEFELQVQSERSTHLTTGDKQGFDVGIEADATWAEVPVKGRFGFKKEMESARDELARTLSASTEKHASSASAKREVRVDTSFEVRKETGIETSVERIIENINVSRTLNFVFRQMNQEFFSILHLVDVRIAFQSGRTRTMVPLHEMDDLLEDVLQPAQRVAAKTMIIDALDDVHDYRGALPPFIKKEKDTRAIAGLVLSVNRELTSNHTDAATGITVTVPGVIRSAHSLVMRTDGVIVDSLLGTAEALDAYSQGLQTEAVREKSLSNDWKALTAKREELAQGIVAARDEVGARLFEQVYEEPADCCCCCNGNGRKPE